MSVLETAGSWGALLPLVLLAAAVGAVAWLLAEPRSVPRGIGTRGGPPRVSVVVPARNEEASLPALLASLRNLAGDDVAEVVVVDDGSIDDTARVARVGGAHVVPAGTPPAGWTGKAWACHVGVEATAGSHVLLLDADTVLAPDALAGLLELHEQHGGLVTVQPHHHAVRAHEQLSAVFNAVSVMASSAFTRRPPSRPMAFGPCLLTSRRELAAAGGHRAVRADVLDDAALGAAYHRAGLPVVATLGGSSVWMRSYPGGVRQLVAGWTKNMAAGASTANRGATLAAVLWVCVLHAVAVGALLAVPAVVTGTGDSLVTGPAYAWLLAYVALAWHVRSVLRRVGRFRWWAWALYPAPLLVFDLVFARSLVHTVVRRSVRWSGRDVDLRSRGTVVQDDEVV